MTPASHREQLIGMLSEAAEIEHCLMCTYLYGAFSLKQSTAEDLTDAELTAVRQWRAETIAIATDEMLHLALVNNLLVAIGAKPHYRRFNFPIAPGLFPADVALSLAPFDEATLDHFVYLERPEDADEHDAQRYDKSSYERKPIANRLMAFADDYTTVGELYQTIAASIQELAQSKGEAGLFVGPQQVQLSEREFGLNGLRVIRNTQDALDAIAFIVRQGEGSPAARSDSHYARFSRIRAQWQELKAARPAFVPYRPAARDPVMRSPIMSQRVHVIAEPASLFLDAGNACYELMLRQLMHLGDAASCGPQERALAADQTLLLMHAVALIGSHLTTLPANAEYPGINAGLTFTVSRGALGYLSHDSSCALMSERSASIALRLASLESELPALQPIAAQLHQAAQAWQARRGQGVVAPSVPATQPATVEIKPAVDTARNGERAIETAEGRDVTVNFETARCIHARHCVLGEPTVFVANQPGEWIFPDRVSAERIAIVAHNCPSGAIQYERRDGQPGEVAPDVNVVRVRENGPLAFHAQLVIAGQPDGMRATLCRCGQSNNKPYCDGSHTAAGFAASGEPATRTSESLTARGGVLQIDPQRNGPLRVTGNLEICAGTGRTVDRVTRTFLCRCGQSNNKPFCDGSHNKAGFTAEGA